MVRTLHPILAACGLLAGLTAAVQEGGPAGARTQASTATEAFNGPFASWRNVRSDFGAVGDGTSDDTATLKAGLASLAESGKGKPGDRRVLYLPAGTYRITAPLVWTNRLGVALLGEDAEATRVLYDGPAGGVMLSCHGVSYSKFGRITWDGQGRAGVAVAHQWDPETKVGPAVTCMEHTDSVFANVEARGLQGRLRVEGVGDASGTVAVFGGGVSYPSVANGGRLVITESWSESNLDMARMGLESSHIHMTGQGYMTLWNAHVAQVQSTPPSIDLDGFSGLFTMVGVQVNHQAKSGLQLRVAGAPSGMKALVMASSFADPEPWFENQAGVDGVVLLSCARSNRPVVNIGDPNPAFLREALKDARTVTPTTWQPAPGGATDVRMHRVSVVHRVGEGFVFRGNAWER